MTIKDDRSSSICDEAQDKTRKWLFQPCEDCHLWSAKGKEQKLVMTNCTSVIN